MKSLLYTGIILLLCSIGLSVHASSSLNESFYLNNMTSPQVSDMFRYGNVETSLFTGKLNIAIPIYTLDDPDFDLNIALRYNSEAFKPYKQSGYVGYNWFLEAGGCITREVKGYPDEMDRKDHTEAQRSYLGMLALLQKQNIDKERVFNEGDYLNSSNTLLDTDYLPDIFHFNFCGYKGSFILNNKGGATILNGDFVNVDLSGLVDCTVNAGEIFVPNASSHITITTMDGCSYVFGGDTSSIEFTVSTTSDAQGIPTQAAPSVSSWHLREIIAPTGRIVAFHYKPLTTIYLHQDPLWSRNDYYDIFVPDDPAESDEHIKHNMTKECILDSIVIQNSPSNQSLKIEFCNSDDPHKLYPHHLGYGNYMLDSIRVHANGSVIRSAVLRKEHRSSTNSYRPIDQYHWRFLSSVNIRGEGIYSLTYNHTGTYPILVSNDNNYNSLVDDFGYYTQDLTLGLLTSVIYPTGGKQTFAYERHDYNKRLYYEVINAENVQLSTSTASYNTNTAGVRLKQVETSENGVWMERKKYTYTQKGSILSSGIHYDTWGTFFSSNAREMTSDSYSLIDTHIGYSYVTETTQYNSTGTPENAVSYTFSTGVDNASYYNNSVNMPQGSTNSSNQNLSASISGALSYNSKLSSIGHLLVKDYYVGNSIVQSHIFKYNAIDNSVAMQPAPTLPSLGATDTIVILSKRYVPVARKMFVYPPVLEQKTTTDFSNGGAFYTYKNIQYDSKLRIKKEIIENSDNMQYFTKYTYPDEIHTNTSTSPYYRLKQENRIKYPIETLMGYIQNHQEKITGGELNLYTNISTHPTLYQTLSLQTTYAIDNYQTITPSGNTLTYDTRYRLKCEYVFDSSLRLKQITPIDRITTTLTWSGIYPITKTINNQTNSYTYSPYVGMTSMTDARGLKIGYGYDSYGRLVSEHMYTSSGQKNVINAYSYHIKDSNALSYRVDMSPRTATPSVLFNQSTMASSNSNTLTTINYFDHFGRPSQVVARKQTPTGKDLVMMTGYTGLNRATHQWLPISEDANGQALSPSEFSNKATTFYGDSRPYQETLYESSALDRIVGAVRPGVAYATHPSTQTYEINAESNIKLFSVVWQSQSNGAVETRLKCGNSNYGLYTLYKSTTSDEDGKSITTFTDKLGRVILERQDGNDTYYVYDNKGQLCYVLPPLASNQISAGTYSNDTDVLKKYAYVYKYDERGNQIYKRLPGCEPTLMVYDVTNMLVMSQTGNQRKRGNYWMVCRYDSLRRLIYTSEVNVSSTYEAYLSSFREWYMREGFSTGTQTHPMANTGYSRGYFHNRPTQLLTVNYYDTYDFLTFVPSAKQSQMEFTSFSGNTSYANATGLLTGSRTYCLDGTGSYSETVYYYDHQGREIQRRTINHFGGYDVLSTKYDFANNITDTWAYQSTNDGLEISEEYHYTYDNANRPLTTRYKYNNDPEIILQSYNYDELGRVRSRHLHGSIDSVAFLYNMQNQITRIKSSGYEQNYYYQESCPLGTGVYPKNNGLITATTWTYGNKINGYEYHYDNMNRLSSTYGILNGSWADGCYSESFMYDAHGNITQLRRWDDHELMNNLSMTYNGNQLIQVNDDGFGTYDYSIKQYHDYNIGSTDFAYDLNGNMTYDKDRGIAYIRYNLLNLPDTIQFTNGNQIVHRYDAAGNRLTTNYYTRKVATTVPLETTLTGTNNTTNYHITRDAFHNHVVYRAKNNNAFGIEFVHNPEGYIRYITVEEYYPFYYIKDLLGNVRETYVHPWAGYKECVQRTQYYPSGLPWLDEMMPSEQPYKYNSKEFVEMHGLDEYDSKARWYYPAICRTTTMDPLAEKYYPISPYAWCKGNPINNIDPFGQDVWEIDSIGRIISRTENKDKDEVFTVTSSGDTTSVSFAYGTIEQQENRKVGDKVKYTWFDVRGDENGTKLFEFFANNTTVEWSQFMMGVEGEKGLNVISTSHDEGTDEAGRFLLENKFLKGYTIREHIHNHPKGTTIPSGITDWTHPKTGVFYPAGTYGDIGVSRWIYDYTHNKNTKFFIYTRINGYDPYSHKQ